MGIATTIDSLRNLPDVQAVTGLNVKSYGAKADGTTDDTAAIQATLNAAGGGLVGTVIVNLANAASKINTPLNVPQNVALVGTYKGPSSHNGYRDGGTYPTIASGGSALIMPAASGSAVGTAAITLNSNSVLQGVVMYDPTQSQSGPVTAAPYWIAMRGKNATVRDCEMVNPYQGIDINNSSNTLAGYTERPSVINVVGQPLFVGIAVGDKGLGGIQDIPRIQNVHFNPYWSYPQAGTSVPATVYNWQQANGTAFLIGDVDEFIMTDCFAYGYFNGVHFTKPSRGAYGSIKGGGFDFCVNPIYSDGSQPGGIRISDCGLIGTGATTAANPVGCTLQAGSGPFCFVNCDFYNFTNGLIYQTAGTGIDTTLFVGCRFSGWASGLPAALIQAAGRLTVTACDFRQASPQVSVSAGAVVIMSGNQLKTSKSFLGAGTIVDTGNAVY